MAGSDGGAYAGFAARMMASGLITDPWVDGVPRFAAAPVVLSARAAGALAAAAEGVAAVTQEALQLLLARPDWLEQCFALTPVQRAMFASSAPHWHAFARADVFLVDDDGGDGGARAVVCELNADTPSGQPEAVLLGPASGVPAARDPNQRLEARFGDLLLRHLGALDRVHPDAPPTLGIVYPTEISGDHALVRLYQRWAEARGFTVALGSPYNLAATAAGGVALLGQPCDIVLRHYKTDWLGERQPAWRDEDPYPDVQPLTGPLAVLLAAVAERRCAVLNPFAAVLAQNKRLFAFFWERLADFSPAAQAIIRAHVPPTFRLEAVGADRLRAERASWVLKSDYGCEGDEVVVGAAVSAALWNEALAAARPERFIVQRYFRARPARDGQIANHGVYLVAGRAAGLYVRLAAGPTDETAQSVAVEITP